MIRRDLSYIFDVMSRVMKKIIIDELFKSLKDWEIITDQSDISSYVIYAGKDIKQRN